MSATGITESPAAYIPMDRRHALVAGVPLPERSQGAALFADISGFTPLTEALARELGPQRGAEELTVHLNRVYDALIAELDGYGGSVIGFSGDAITCWFEGGTAGTTHATRRAIACSLAMQSAMRQFAEVRTHSGRVVSLAVKCAVAAGAVRRFVVGDPDYCIVDVMAGATLDHLAAAEHQAQRGEVVVDRAAAEPLGDSIDVAEWRTGEHEGAGVAVVTGQAVAVPAAPWPQLPVDAPREDVVRSWLLPPVRERLYRGRGEFLAELRPAVALFLRFLGIDYDNDETASARLDTFIREVEQVLMRYDGSLIQLTVGDKGSYLYAAFGAPIAHEDDAARACNAALELQALARRMPFLAPPQLGVTQGRMRTGAYGGVTRRTYGVLGDAVNLSARLMSAAEPGQILVSELVRQAAGGKFDWEMRPAITVKGKSEPVAIERLVGRRGKASIHLNEPRYALPMVGRETELALIGAKRRLAWRGQGQIVGLTAEAGMGKSRLAAEVIRLAAQQGFVVFAGEAQSYGTNTSYLVWQTIWRGLFGLDADQSLEEQARQLEEQLERLDASLVPRLPLLGPVLNLSLPDNELTRTFDAKLRKSSLEALLVDVLRLRAREQPIVLLLEDCHWLDPLSHDLIEQIGRLIGDLPVFMLLAYRPPDVKRLQAPRVEQLPYFTLVTLTDFTPEEARRLIQLKLAQQLGDTAAVPAEFIQRITERASGNPFYIEELLNYLHDRHVDPHNAAALAALELPSSLASLILSRIDRLNESQKMTIKVASVIGRLFRAAMVWGVYPELGQEQAVEQDLQVLSNLDLTPMDTPDPELTYLFKHVITQQVAYESLLYATRAMLHNEIGRFIEGNYAHTLDQYVDLLAFHYSRSENEPKQREYLLKAGEAAQAAYANSSAVEYYRQVLPLLDERDQPRVLLNLGLVLEIMGEWAEAGENVQRAMSLAERLGDTAKQAEGQRAFGRLKRKQGDYAEATAWLERARASFAQLNDAGGMSYALSDSGEIYRLQGRYAEARRYYDVSLELANVIPDEQVRLAARAYALKGAGTVATWQGDYVTSRALGEESLAIRRQLQSKVDIATQLNNLGIVALFQRDLEQARITFEESLMLFRELGDRWSIGQVLNNCALVSNDLLDRAEAHAHLQESLQIRRQLGDRAGLALSLNTLADVVLDEGDYDAAYPLLRESLLINRELSDKQAIAYLLEDYGGLAAAKQQPERALRLAGFATALRETIGAPLPPAEKSRLDRMLEPARQALDTTATAAAWSAGQAMTLQDAIDYALANGSIS